DGGADRLHAGEAARAGALRGLAGVASGAATGGVDAGVAAALAGARHVIDQAVAVVIDAIAALDRLRLTALAGARAAGAGRRAHLTIGAGHAGGGGVGAVGRVARRAAGLAEPR